MIRGTLTIVLALWLFAGESVRADETVAKPTPASLKRLNLKLPDITTILTTEQIDSVLSRTINADNLEEVEVEGSRLPEKKPPDSPEVWGGLAAPFWALMHPTQAWRILAPIPPDRAQYIGNAVPDATDSNNRPVDKPYGIASGF